MLQIIKKLRILLDKKQKRAMAGLVVLMIIGAFLQTAGVGMLVQAVNVVIDPQVLEKSGLVRCFYDFLGCRDFRSFSITVMVLLVVTFAVKNFFLFVQQKLMFAFVYTNQFATSERMMRNYLRRGYEFYLNADTAVVQRNITSDVNNTGIAAAPVRRSDVPVRGGLLPDDKRCHDSAAGGFPCAADGSDQKYPETHYV